MADIPSFRIYRLYQPRRICDLHPGHVLETNHRKAAIAGIVTGFLLSIFFGQFAVRVWVMIPDLYGFYK